MRGGERDRQTDGQTDRVRKEGMGVGKTGKR